MSTTHPLLLQPEGKTLEFKRDLSSPQNLLKTLVAFANSAGGRLVIGVDDARRVVGVSVDGVIASIAEFTGVDSVIHARPPASLPQHHRQRAGTTIKSPPEAAVDTDQTHEIHPRRRHPPRQPAGRP
ncbi:MAG TPA: ATP-binding protein, partial [Alicycliphilus sp.]|nr:ATP-binding protein [Alicycliphilus sp.]